VLDEDALGEIYVSKTTPSPRALLKRLRARSEDKRRRPKR
jgi:hypothetical protein